jgi:hypothetical protein
MATRFNSFRAERYLRSRFVEGRFLLSSEATDLELELLDFAREMLRKTMGNFAVGEGWKVERLSNTELLIKPGELWFDGMPFSMRSGFDQLVSGSGLALGTVVVPGGGPQFITVADAADGSGKILTFNDGGNTPTGTYKIIISLREEVVTFIQDAFLKNFNVPEDTAQKLRTNIRINIVPESAVTETPVPYTSTTSGNLVNRIKIIPQPAGNGSVVSINPISGAEELDGRDLEIIVRNNSAATNPLYPGSPVGILFPTGAAEQQEFTNGRFIDSEGNEFHLNLITNDVVANQLILRIDKEVGQQNPIITDTEPYYIVKRDFYVTDDVNGNPQGQLFSPIAVADWVTTTGFVHQSSIQDLRRVVDTSSDFQQSSTRRDNIKVVGGGLISAEPKDKAEGSIIITDYTNLSGDTFSINGVNFVEGVDFVAGTSNSQTAQNLATAITISTNPLVDNIVTATAIGAIVELEADEAGSAGNSITLSYTDSGSGVGASVSGATLVDGADEIPGQLIWGPEDIELLSGNTPVQVIESGEAILQEKGSLAYKLDWQGGIISKGILALTSTTSGTVLELSGSPDLSDLKLGHTVYLDDTDESSFIVAIDDIAKTITVDSALSSSGNITIFKDTYANQYLPVENDWFVLATVVSSKFYIGSALVIPSGETNEIVSGGTGVPQQLLDYIGSPAATDNSPAYISTTNIAQGDNLTLASGKLDRSIGEIQKILGLLNLTEHADSDKAIITAAEDMLLDGTIISQELSTLILSFDETTIDFTNGTISGGATGENFTPFTIPVGEYFWYGVGLILDDVTVENRALGLVQVVPASAADSVQADAPFPNVIGDKKLGAVQLYNNAGTLEVVEVRRLGVGSGSGGAGLGLIKVDLYDPVSTSLPTGANPTVDGTTVLENDLVFFTNLATNNERIYKATNVSTSVVWSAQKIFLNSSETPSLGDSIRVKKGDLFNGQIVYLDENSEYIVNDVVRFFDGNKGTNYWELGSLKTITLTNNVTNGVIFSVNATNSENWIISYSISRGPNKETGQLYITSDGTNVSVATNNSYIGDSGISFYADIISNVLYVRYDSTNTGLSATMKLFVSRWSDSPGGPSGVPSYSSASSVTAAAGATSDVQFKGGDGNLAADADFKWNIAEKSIDLDGLLLGKLQGPEILLNNQASPQTIFSYDDSYKWVIIEYSLERDGQDQVGRLMIVNNGSIVNFSEDFVGTSALGITFAVQLSGGNVVVQYTSTNTGFNANFRWSVRKW